ncbi:uncharacterized protein RHOBADRAFT_52417 [Rhodotorula graminis WP1]|uniref:MHD domain-containing protein n=1 Tax=Rhodotorula graminis (strain WP1) TaxID=578459 RepID=A0A194SAI1_RHOGW|nr:uncharacterized protein RHOBADRAFT_52417 [Rhodotorula graminis WP1]KPV76406.1 hypothetical protein RHOBADRAFT_52417 [Rhodotorula graminis WP1]
MQGIAITDLQGRRILSTHFPSSLSTALAIDAAVQSSHPVVWVPAPQAATASAQLEGDSDQDDDDDDDEQPWADSARRTSSSTRTGPSGVAVCHIQRNGLRYIAPVSRDIDPLVPLTFLTELHEVLQAYIVGPVTEGSLKDNFDVILALLHEMVAGGRPQLSQASQLKELVVPPDSQLLKVALNAATAAGITMIPPQTTANALIASPLPWRRQGIKYASNEIYFDLSETLSFTLSPSGTPLSASIAGTLSCRSRLSGMPDLALHFTDPSVLDESCAFHSCVRYARWKKDRVVSFVPPDGTFPLLSFLHTPPSTTPALALALLPLTLSSTLTHGPLGAAFHLALTSRANPAHPLRNVEVRVPLARGASNVQAQASGGAYLRDEGGRAVGGGAGAWEVVSELLEGEGAGEERQTLVWRIESLGATDRPAVLSGQYLTAPESRKPPAFTVTFDTPSTAFSGLRISALKLVGEPYSVYKGVKSSARGVVEVRTG